MAEPRTVSIKRRATDEPPDVLLLTQNKRPATGLRYVRQDGQADATRIESESKVDQSKPTHVQDAPASQRRQAQTKRFFHLNRIPSVTGKRKQIDGPVAIFVEKRLKSEDHSSRESTNEEQVESTTTTATEQPLKRPGKSAAVTRPAARPTAQPESEADRRQVEQLANYMHEAALDEFKREQNNITQTRPASAQRRVVTPKLTAEQSRELHRRRAATSGSVSLSKDIDMEDESHYVYDTYILAPASELGADESSISSGMDNVGYLVILDEDESLWQTYLEDEPSDKDWNSDEEDENAEDYYGADYPEDELESDDEFDRNPYACRERAGSDDEAWDEDAHADGYSDDDEYDRTMNPFKCSTMTTPKQFAKYLNGTGAANDSD